MEREKWGRPRSLNRKWTHGFCSQGMWRPDKSAAWHPSLGNTGEILQPYSFVVVSLAETELSSCTTHAGINGK